ncbi:Flp pilus assembly protein CpaB [Brevundimonas sp. BAL450]|jgi:pilus assembly protein CpaB|uniref:Flp pilus assembly protein RcpC/CpaB n=1 Tax=Brevundimonas abyssalis TAR-001 TaxID=1391729 RepID=A0A8E0NC70_9CAUL|nr:MULTISPECIES: Flp pilus assembly protein CpaB [Brevundimonas]MBG7615654.1 Flp pilus assembly protein CpaB [Brevundimonas sp. BAL450]GAD59672.1 flp pilus assembly protein RcpC/CpaB [Brevundimonas abyssalis TAR-001]
MKPARIAVIGIAAVAAIALALVVRAMGNSGGEPTATASAAVEAPRMARVLVAARDVPVGKRLEAGDMEWKDWPIDGLNPAYVTDGSVALPAAAPPAEGEAEAAPAVENQVEGAAATVTRAVNAVAGTGAQSDFIGSVVREGFVAGEPIVARKIVRSGDSGFLAAYLEPGMRAMAIRVSVETAAGGFILPGDRVDVIMTRELRNNNQEGGSAQRHTTTTVMQNVKVLAVDQTTQASDDAQSVVGATATLEVSPGDAEVLSLARAEGDLSLVLRSYADAAGPSGRTGRMASGGGDSRVVRIHRGDQVETVVLQ